MKDNQKTYKRRNSPAVNLWSRIIEEQSLSGKLMIIRDSPNVYSGIIDNIILDFKNEKLTIIPSKVWLLSHGHWNNLHEAPSWSADKKKLLKPVEHDDMFLWKIPPENGAEEPVTIYLFKYYFPPAI